MTEKFQSTSADEQARALYSEHKKLAAPQWKAEEELHRNQQMAESMRDLDEVDAQNGDPVSATSRKIRDEAYERVEQSTQDLNVANQRIENQAEGAKEVVAQHAGEFVVAAAQQAEAEGVQINSQHLNS